MKSFPEELRMFGERCSVTAFDLHLMMTRDGRERGIWFILVDTSPERARTYQTWLEDAAAIACKIMGTGDGDERVTKFGAWLSLDSAFRHLTNAQVREGALLEWPAVKKLHALLGEEIAKHEASNSATAP